MINFMRYRKLYLFISLVVIVPGLFILFTRGLTPAIDFTGGTVYEFKLKSYDSAQDEISIEELKQTVSEKFEVGQVQMTSENTYVLKLKPLDETQRGQLVETLKAKYGDIEEIQFETVGPTLGRELLTKTLIASLVAIIGILYYVAWTFKNIRYGVSAIVALIHDVLVVVGVFAILGILKGVEVDSLFVTAVLTTMSFSVHDTIVVFDRIRENQKKQPRTHFEDILNLSLTETMGRSLNNSLTIIFMLLALVLLGGSSVQWFALALLIGTISGTYSSPFVATPILYVWSTIKSKK